VPGPHRNQPIEHKFDSRSARLRGLTGAAQSLSAPRRGRRSADLGDNTGQQGITNLEVSGRFAAMRWVAELLNWAFSGKGHWSSLYRTASGFS
jgi:hypothetical protein